MDTFPDAWRCGVSVGGPGLTQGRVLPVTVKEWHVFVYLPRRLALWGQCRGPGVTQGRVLPVTVKEWHVCGYLPRRLTLWGQCRTGWSGISMPSDR